MTTTAQDILTALACSNSGCKCQRALKAGLGSTHCPAHDDRDPSLLVDEKDGKTLWFCGAGCDQAKVMAALQDKGIIAKPKGGTSSSRTPRSKKTTTKAVQETRYEIRDVNGDLVAVHVRRDIAVGNKEVIWEGGLGGRKTENLPLYGSDLLAQRPDEPVVITEGEKAADALRQVKVLALGTVTGASVAPSTDALRPVAGRRAFLWPDNDEPGLKHMEKIARRLHELGCEIFIVVWPDAPPKGDAADCPPDRYAGLIGAAERWEPEPVENGAVLFDDVGAFLRRFVVFPSTEAAHAATLWAAHTHCFDEFDCTPYLRPQSPEKSSGKTRLLEAAELLVARPRVWANASVSALFRVVERDEPTLLFDEMDAVFNGKKTDSSSEDLRGLLNAGYRRGATVARVVGEGSSMDIKDFAVYCPKALAGLGDLPDTIKSRSIVIRMRKRAPNEKIERFRRRKAEPDGFALRDRLAKWTEAHRDQLHLAEPEIPDTLTDRAADMWEPLIAIADQAGGDWPARARAAAIAFGSPDAEQDGSLGVLLLSDIRTAFEESDVDRFTSAVLVEKMVALEERPWNGINKGQPMTQHTLASMLRRYDVRPNSVKVTVDGQEKSPKGYLRAWFEDAFSRYLPPLPEKGAKTATPQPGAPSEYGTPPGGSAADPQPKATKPQPRNLEADLGAVNGCGVAVSPSQVAVLEEGAAEPDSSSNGPPGCGVAVSSPFSRANGTGPRCPHCGHPVTPSLHPDGSARLDDGWCEVHHYVRPVWEEIS